MKRDTGYTANEETIREGDIVEMLFLHPVHGPYTEQGEVIWLEEMGFMIQVLRPDKNQQITAFELSHYAQYIHRIIGTEPTK